MCDYYLDYLIEDSTDSISAFASGRNLSYVQLGNPEFSSAIICLSHRKNKMNLAIFILSRLEEIKEKLGGMDIQSQSNSLLEKIIGKAEF